MRLIVGVLNSLNGNVRVNLGCRKAGVTEQGLDPSQLQQAMGSVDTAALGAALDKQGA